MCATAASPGRYLQFSMAPYFNFNFLLPLFVLAYLAALLFNQKPKGSSLNRPIVYHSTFLALVILNILGFLFNLDNNQSSGCLITDQPVFRPTNITYSLISISLFVVAYSTQQKKLRALLISVEFVYWLAKLSYLKGGYAIGIAGVPIREVVIFDATALLLRLVLIRQVLQLTMSTFFLILLSALILFIRRGRFFG
jgi:hypothetical protein